MPSNIHVNSADYFSPRMVVDAPSDARRDESVAPNVVPSVPAVAPQGPAGASQAASQAPTLGPLPPLSPFLTPPTPRPGRPTLTRNPTTWTPGETADYVARPAERFELQPLTETATRRRPSTVQPRAVPWLGWSIPSRWQMLAIGISGTALVTGLSTLSIAISNKVARQDAAHIVPAVLNEIISLLMNGTSQGVNRGHAPADFPG